MEVKEETKEKSAVHKRSSLINEFLWMCAGVNRKVLRQCPNDYAKYAGMGGVILFTALMAAFSGGYAISTVFDDMRIVIFFAIFWGLLIFNLDRFIVNTIYSDGKVTISRQELFAGMPRIIMAIFLGIIISTPLEMRIFRDSIEMELNKMQSEAVAERTNDELKNEIAERERKRDELIKAIDNRNLELNKERDKVDNEIKGLGITGKKGYGPVAKKLEESYNIKRKQIEEYNKRDNEEIERLQLEIAELKIKQKAEEEKTRSVADNLDGFTARLKALNSVASFERDKTLWLVRMFIALLFITIEITPTLFKLMIARGPYDAMIEAENHKIEILSDKIISDINDEINTAITISSALNKDKADEEIRANREVTKKIAEVQSELLEIAIEKWRDEELEKIKNNPSEFLKIETEKVKV